ncbi:TonB-dependent receptor [Dasania marina]|uniref:TonB-dependent receptor n=1 Tax=Dasania marina TaxID=471499 RepID=UPI000382E7A4|nr:TonB-dependent receptor [Dasania marina]
MATSLTPSAFAQELEEVMVTATKRSESVQDVPLAITAFSGNFTKDVNMDDVKDLVSFTPGVTGNSQDSFIDAISIRGIRTQDFGIGGDPSAAFFKNDLYEGRNGSAVTSLFDMERSEILRGPQGFLFGRNSIGGAFSVHTQKAQIGGTDGYVDVDLGENEHRTIEAAQNVPVNDNFAMRFAGYYSHEGGVIENQYRGDSRSKRSNPNSSPDAVADSAFLDYDGDDLISHEKAALRFSTTYEKDQLMVQTFVEYETRKQSGSVYRAVQEGDTWDKLTAAIPELDPLKGGEFDLDSDLGQGDDDDADILTLGLKIEYDFDFATLTSNTGYKDHDYYYNEDYDGTPLYLSNYGQDQEGDYFQQEFRLTSNTDGALSWYAGASYYKEEIETTFLLNSSEDHMCQIYGYLYSGYEYDGYDGDGYKNYVYDEDGNYIFHADQATQYAGCADLYPSPDYDFAPSSDGLLKEQGTIRGKYTGWSTYVDLTYQVNDQFEVEVGARYTYDEKDFDINVKQPESWLGNYWAYGFSTDGWIKSNADWSDTQTRILGRYRPNDEALIYASYTEGFKAGGFASFGLADASGTAIGYDDDLYSNVKQSEGYQAVPFNPEVVDSYEIGYKDTLFDGTADISLTAFYYEYEDLQVVVSTDSGAASVENVGQSESFGLEGTITAPINDNFSIYMALSYLDSEATDIQKACNNTDACEGSSLFWAPEYSGAVVLNHRMAIDGGELKGSLEVFGESSRGGGWEGLKETEIDAQYEAAFRYGFFSDNGWNVGMYIENLTDEDGWDGQNNNGGILPAHFFGQKRPRTFGLNLGYEWE